MSYNETLNTRREGREEGGRAGGRGAATTSTPSRKLVEALHNCNTRKSSYLRYILQGNYYWWREGGREEVVNGLDVVSGKGMEWEEEEEGRGNGRGKGKWMNEGEESRTNAGKNEEWKRIISTRPENISADLKFT